MGIYMVIIMSGFFIVSSISKFFSISDFMKTLYNVGIAQRYLRIVAWSLAIAEVVTALLLLIPISKRIGAIVLLLQLIVFMSVTVRTIAQKKKLNCNCFGSLLPSELGWKSLIRLILFTGMGVIILLDPKVNPYAVLGGDLFYQISSSIGIIVLYVVITRVVSNMISIREEGA